MPNLYDRTPLWLPSPNVEGDTDTDLFLDATTNDFWDAHVAPSRTFLPRFQNVFVGCSTHRSQGHFLHFFQVYPSFVIGLENSRGWFVAR